MKALRGAKAEERPAFPVRRFLSLSFRSPNVPTAERTRVAIHAIYIYIYVEREKRAV